MEGWGPGWVWFTVGQVLWWLFVVVGVVVLLRWTLGRGPHRRPPPPPDRAIELLRERYARGEIDQNEFEERKRVLGG